jgi:hypothetical protein
LVAKGGSSVSFGKIRASASIRMPSCGSGSAQHLMLMKTYRMQRAHHQRTNEGYLRFNMGKECIGLILSYPH